MNKVLKAIKKVAKGLNMDTKGVDHISDRYHLSDGFTTILAAKEGGDIGLWAEAHKRFVKESWPKIISGNTNTKNKYQEVVVDKLRRCNREPEIDIVYETNLDGVEVVVYTDNIDALVAEAERFKGV